MKHLGIGTLLAAIATGAYGQPAARPTVDLACQPEATGLAYLCTVHVRDAAGQPVSGVQVTLSADMPSMPMAHNVPPVMAEPLAGEPGRYQARLVLEMPGEWLVRLRFQAPRPDVVVRKLDFQKDKVSPAGPR